MSKGFDDVLRQAFIAGVIYAEYESDTPWEKEDEEAFQNWKRRFAGLDDVQPDHERFERRLPTGSEIAAGVGENAAGRATPAQEAEHDYYLTKSSGAVPFESLHKNG